MATSFADVQATVSTDARRAERHELAITRASVRAHGDQPAAATLRDLSIYGCRVATAGDYDAGARLWLRIDGGLPIAASVVWADGEQLGCRFDEPIANALMRQLTRDAPSDQPTAARHSRSASA